MTPAPLLRNSKEHIARVFDIDMRFNRLALDSRRDFLLAHPGADLEASHEYQQIVAVLDQNRLAQFAELRMQLVDDPILMMA